MFGVYGEGREEIVAFGVVCVWICACEARECQLGTAKRGVEWCGADGKMLITMFSVSS